MPKKKIKGSTASLEAFTLDEFKKLIERANAGEVSLKEVKAMNIVWLDGPSGILWPHRIVS